MNKIIHLYHGTTVFFEKPDLKMAKPYKDFGKGFYLTTNLCQAGKWAIRNLIPDNIDNCGYIYEYTFNMKSVNSLACLELLTYNIEWVKTISWYRNNLETKIKYDLIYDRMADGNYRELINVLQRYDRKQASIGEVLSVTRFRGVCNDQYCFKTPKALAYLCDLRYAKVYNYEGTTKVINWYNKNGTECADE